MQNQHVCVASTKHGLIITCNAFSVLYAGCEEEVVHLFSSYFSPKKDKLRFLFFFFVSAPIETWLHFEHRVGQLMEMSVGDMYIRGAILEAIHGIVYGGAHGVHIAIFFFFLVG